MQHSCKIALLGVYLLTLYIYIAKQCNFVYFTKREGFSYIEEQPTKKENVMGCSSISPTTAFGKRKIVVSLKMWKPAEAFLFSLANSDGLSQ